MPIYEYKCTKGHVFDTMQRMSEAPLTECQICGAPAQRVLHAPAVHFKGSGFYNTDYGTRRRQREAKEAGEGGSGAAAADKGSGGEGAGSEGKKSESSTASSSSSSSSPASSSSN